MLFHRVNARSRGETGHISDKTGENDQADRLSVGLVFLFESKRV